MVLRPYIKTDHSATISITELRLAAKTKPIK